VACGVAGMFVLVGNLRALERAALRFCLGGRASRRWRDSRTYYPPQDCRKVPEPLASLQFAK
jgi:hypothetical protein